MSLVGKHFFEIILVLGIVCHKSIRSIYIYAKRSALPKCNFVFTAYQMKNHTVITKKICFLGWDR